jgi:hypothetical protein
MAESAVVNPTVLVAAFDPWARSAATMIAGVAGSAVTVLDVDTDQADRLLHDGASADLGVLIVSGLERDQAELAHVQARLVAARSALEARYVAHLTIERDAGAIWVGPTVMPLRPGCDRCWQARRRQHVDALSRGLAPAHPGTAAADHATVVSEFDLARLGAKAGLAVMRRVLGSPDTEAGVVRRFAPGGGSPSIGRVVAVSGCARCDRTLPLPAGWSLRRGAAAGVAMSDLREEVKYEQLSDNSR